MTSSAQIKWENVWNWCQETMKDGAGLRDQWGSFAALFLSSLVIFTLLYSDIPLDDTGRFASQLIEGKVVWEASHVLLAPVSQFWFRLTGSFLSAELSLKLLSSISASAYLVVAFVCARDLRLRRLTAIAVLVLCAGAMPVLQLATSGHVKLLAAPWFALGIRSCLLWAQAEERRDAELCRAGIWFGIAASLLISFALVGPAIALVFFLAGLWQVLQRQVSAREALLSAVRQSLNLGLPMVAILGLALWVGFWAAQGTDAPPTGFMAWLFAETAEYKSAGSLPSLAMRAVYGTLGTLVWIPDLGAILRAKMAGDVVPLAKLTFPLVRDFLLILLGGGLLAAAALTGALSIKQRQVGVTILVAVGLALFGFLLAWGYYEAEFQFPLVLPVALILGMTLDRARSHRLAELLLIAVIIVVTANVTTYSVPRALVDKEAGQIELAELIGPRDLVITSSSWTDRPSLYAYDVPSQEVFYVNKWQANGGRPSAAELKGELLQQMEVALASGNRVFIFRLLDQKDWSPPWSYLHSIRLTKEDLEQVLAENYNVSAEARMAGIPYWEITRFTSGEASAQ